MKTRVLFGLAASVSLMLAACAPTPASTGTAGEVTAGVATVETMHPLAGEIVGARDGHGEHSYDTPPIESLGGAVELVEATSGHPFSDKNLLGSWSLVYFGYMECLEACPIALKTIPVAAEQLKAKGVPVKSVFIDINAPRLDDMTGGMGHGEGHGAATPVAAHGGHGGAALTGPEIRRQAIAAWGPKAAPGMIFLSGTRKQLAVATRAFQSRIEAAMLKNDEPIHHINHTTNIYVLDPQGRVVSVMYHSDPVKQMVETMTALVKAAPGASTPAPAPAEHAKH